MNKSQGTNNMKTTLVAAAIVALSSGSAFALDFNTPGLTFDSEINLEYNVTTEDFGSIYVGNVNYQAFDQLRLYTGIEVDLEDPNATGVHVGAELEFDYMVTDRISLIHTGTLEYNLRTEESIVEYTGRVNYGINESFVAYVGTTVNLDNPTWDGADFGIQYTVDRSYVMDQTVSLYGEYNTDSEQVVVGARLNF
jgi:hypothetical protein